MNHQLVQAVFFARYNKSNFKALYGRLPGTTYTKDYIQIPSAVSKEMKDALGATTDKVDVEYCWPTGSQSGHFAWSTDRYHLKWDTDSPPLPWKLGIVGADPAVSLPGDTSKKNEADADAQFAAIEGSNQKPWLLAVMLAGEPNRLHLRVYFENPPATLTDRALSALPKELQDAIAKLNPSDGTGFVDWTGNITSPLPNIRAKRLVAEIRAALARDPNVLVVGPPGTGKSVALEDLRVLYTRHAVSGSAMFDPFSWSGDWKQDVGPEARSEALVFHPSYSYENFVAGLFPKTSSGGIELEAKPGPLLCLSHWIGDTDRQALLILDAFNRGPAAAIFGDTLGLLDKDKRANGKGTGAYIQRPYPSQAMPVPKAYAHDPAKSETVADEVRLPAGLHIVAAMNSTDRSVAPLDAAMRRRFTVIRVRPDYEALREHLGVTVSHMAKSLPLESDPANWPLESVSILAIQVLQSLNERIEYCLGEDFLLGQALVWDMNAAASQDRLGQLAAAVDTKVLPTLRMTFVDQDEALAAVLGVPDSLQMNPGQPGPDDVVAYWRTAPASLASIAQKRLVLQSVCAMPGPKRLAALMLLTEG